MNTKIIKLFTLSVIGFFPFVIQAQFNQVSEVLKGGIDDAQKLSTEYMRPFGKGLAINLSNGLYNTAKPHSFPNPAKMSFFLGLDITVTTSMLAVPEIDKTYDASKLGLKTLVPTGNNTIGQTVSGTDKIGPELGFGKLPNGAYMNKFNMPKGTGFAYVPGFMVQAGIGLPFSTELDFRFIPTVSAPMVDFKVGALGFGLKHSIKQWIPVLSMMPFFDISAQAGYTSLKTSLTGSIMAFDPASFNNGSSIDKTQFNNQGIELNASSFTGNIVVSTDIPIFNVYAGVGFYTASSTFKLTGNYAIPEVPTAAQLSANQTKPNATVVSNPINLNFDGNGGMRANIGIRLKLLVFAINGDIAFAGGNTIYTAGFGINFH